jgi:F-type H+-transporting ATPase subunit delta
VKRTARPYARAVLGAAGTLEGAEAVRDQLRAFAELLAEVPALREAVANPALPVEVKRRAVDAVGARIGLEPLAARLLTALAGRHRLGELADVVTGIGELLDERRGVAVAEVKTAEPLAEEERTALQQTLERQVGKRLQLRLDVEPSLLAGFVARVESQLFDGSLRGQLDRLAKELATT